MVEGIVHMITTKSNLLGLGLFTPVEAAFYARIQPRTMVRWIYGNSQGKSVISPQRGTESKDVSFLDFVQSLAIRAITTSSASSKVPLQKIREAIVEAKNKYGIDYPFARAHTTYIFGNEVVIKLNNDDYRQASGDHKGNRMLTKVVELYMRDLTFDSSGLASAYTAWSKNEYKIVIDPTRRFGEPILSNFGYSAQTLWNAVATEGSVEAAADAYEVPEEAIVAACEYFDHLQGASAA